MKIREVLAASRGVLLYSRALLRASYREDTKIDDIVELRRKLLATIATLRRSVRRSATLEANARTAAEAAEREIRAIRNRLSQRIVAKEAVRVGEIVAELDRVVKRLATALDNGPSAA